mmetsp:Transcript_16374/g.27984  ORF Transcript_16374/g.27984 Transcript_16374/m.27984 type:complete len:314 (+) Transcript_16374:267-1208(+)
MSDNSLPSTIRFVSFDNHAQARFNDDQSEMTASAFGDGTLNAADHVLDRQITANNESEQEFIDLKQQIAKQKEELDGLSLKLQKCLDENEAMRKEKRAIADALKNETDPRPIQFLVETNTKLLADNTRLKAVLDITRKSFKKHIEDTRKGCNKDKRASDHLQQENVRLRKQLIDTSARETILSKETATTSPLDGSGRTLMGQQDTLSPLDSAQRPSSSSKEAESLQDFFEREVKNFEPFDNDRNTKTEHIENRVIKNPKAIEAASRRQPRQKMAGRLCQSMSEGSKNQELLVDFGGRRKNMNTATRWRSFRLT